ncbi:cytochrome B5-like protein isoform X2 [Cephus cinctus]|uniref:Cytochrome B5-like protein isoform X2 n=1 Tax=Cephus cinctus TaxID=211228 RepID=A0AAJ7FTL5_CEPCN|nr:cytochrome B5-like protein isoform X2 [Cephus cinctus]
MSFEQDHKVETSSSKMLNVRTLPDTTGNRGADLLRVSLKVQSLSLDESEKFVEKRKSESSDVQDNCKSSILKIISLDEIAWHDTLDDCWFAIYDYVYDCTGFVKDHPGGLDVILEYAGRDATLSFIGTGHSKFAKQTLEKYLIGELPLNERIYRIPGGVKITGF